MFRIDTSYMNECFKRTLNEGSHSIHCNDASDVISYLADTYAFDVDSSHVVTKSGHVFEVKIASDNCYVTLISE